MCRILSNIKKLKNMATTRQTKINLHKYVCKQVDIPKESYFRYVYCYNNKQYATTLKMCIELNKNYSIELDNNFIDTKNQLVFFESAKDIRNSYQMIIPQMFDDKEVLQSIDNISIDLIKEKIKQLKADKEIYGYTLFDIAFNKTDLLLFLQVMKESKATNIKIELINYDNDTNVIRFCYNDIKCVLYPTYPNTDYPKLLF